MPHGKPDEEEVDAPLHYDPEVMQSDYTRSFQKYIGHKPPGYAKTSKRSVPEPTKFEGVSMNKTDFQTYPNFRPPESFKPSRREVAVTASGGNTRFEGQSSYSSEMVTHARSIRAPFIPKKGSIELGAKFEGQATSKSDFQFAGTEPYINKTQPFLPAKGALGGGASPAENRDFHTENSLKFIQLPYAKTADFKPSNKLAAPRKFEGSSTSSTDFVDWKGKPPQSFKPKSELSMVEENRDWQTESGSSFVPMGPGAKTFKKAPQSHASGSKFEGSSTNKEDFIHYGAVPIAAPFKPKGSSLSTASENRDFATESTLSYTAKPYAVVASTKKVIQYARTEDNRDFQTETQMNLIDKGHAVRAPFLPAKGSITSGNDFYAQTTSGSDFVYHGYAKRPMMVPTRNMGQEKEDRVFETEGKSKFIDFGHQPVRQPFKPKKGRRTII